jgi:geranylgeranyl pyrophosphate synthase
MQKAALPLIYGFKSGSAKFQTLIPEKSSNLGAISPEKLNDIRKELAACGAEEQCFRDARRYYQQALSSLRDLNMGSPEIGVLQGILHSCVSSVGVA